MFAALRSEFRKLLTVRSTYAIVIISLIIVALFAGYGEGFRATPEVLHDSGRLMSESFSAITFVGLILAFVGLLLLGHEYRYNTVTYSLTITNRRAKVLLAKVLAITAFAVVISLLVTFFSPLCALVGAHLHGYHFGPQRFDYWSVIWRCIFVGWGYAMYAFILIALLRNQIGAIVTFLLIPLIGENIIEHIFTSSDKYLPFTMLQAVTVPNGMGNHTTTAHALVVALVYIVSGLIVGWVLFLRRDAN